jgi:hypothetical protein
MINKIHAKEQSKVKQLNARGWNLTWSGGGYDHYDAIGETCTGKKCVLEFKFRNDSYKTKMIEVYKYDKLLAMDDYLVFYLVSEQYFDYIFDLRDLTDLKTHELQCPTTTLWKNEMITKKVYLLNASDAETILTTLW